MMSDIDLQWSILSSTMAKYRLKKRSSDIIRISKTLKNVVTHYGDDGPIQALMKTNGIAMTDAEFEVLMSVSELKGKEQESKIREIMNTDKPKRAKCPQRKKVPAKKKVARKRVAKKKVAKKAPVMKVKPVAPIGNNVVPFNPVNTDKPLGQGEKPIRVHGKPYWPQPPTSNLIYKQIDAAFKLLCFMNQILITQLGKSETGAARVCVDIGGILQNMNYETGNVFRDMANMQERHPQQRANSSPGLYML